MQIFYLAKRVCVSFLRTQFDLLGYENALYIVKIFLANQHMQPKGYLTLFLLPYFDARK